jgi:hypothetical protein
MPHKSVDEQLADLLRGERERGEGGEAAKTIAKTLKLFLRTHRRGTVMGIARAALLRLVLPSVVVLVAGFWLSWIKAWGDQNWFARSGGLVTFLSGYYVIASRQCLAIS